LFRVSGAVAAGTVAEALTAAGDALTAAGVDSPRLDAELLLAKASGRDRVGLLADSATPVSPSAARAFGAMVRRRVRREPVAYILGRKAFRRIELVVDRRVLIPRPETELLVEVALEIGPGGVLDVGTGSGAVALAVADELGDVAVRGTDTSTGALEVARANAARLGLDRRVSFDLARSLRHAKEKRQPPEIFDLVVANLPYVPDSDWRSLAPEIRDYEPREALLAGPDGLDAIRDLLASPPDCQAIALEVGQGQAAAVSELVAEAGFDNVETRRDLAGIERVVLGRR
jgi:release factor glutamine methyltransferase